MLVIIAPAFQLLTCDRPVLTLNCPLALTPESRVQSAAHIPAMIRSYILPV